MIAADTSTLIAFHSGASGKDIERLIEALQAGILVLPSTVVAELLSDPKLPVAIEKQILRIPQIPLLPGYWERVGEFRRAFLKKKVKCRLADAQITQSCIDAKIPLICRDHDFNKYAKVSGLSIIMGP